MDKTCENAKRFGKEGNGLAVRVGWSREEIVSKARMLIRIGGSQERREIVKTALDLDRLLQEGLR